MKITSWTINVTLEDGKEESIADIPDWVAKHVDEYLSEKEEYSKSKKEEDNKLIAEFMDMKVSTDGTQVKCENWFYVDLDSTFNTSWDWLMPVVNKILFIKPDFEYVIDLEVTYPAVVKFIKEYNYERK